MNGKRMLQNLPFAVSGGVLLALWAAGNSKKAVESSCIKCVFIY